MPKVRPLTQSQRNEARWKAQNTNFRMQIGMLFGQMGCRQDVAGLGALFGLKDSRAIRRVMDDPGVMTKAQERRVILAFEKAGLRYDPTLGEGAQA